MYLNNKDLVLSPVLKFLHVRGQQDTQGSSVGEERNVMKK